MSEEEEDEKEEEEDEEEEEILPGITTRTKSKHYNFSGLINFRNYY
jgi:hypothetical protein